MDVWFAHKRVVEIAHITDGADVLEYQDYFSSKGIGRNFSEYERGKTILREDTTLNAKQYEQALKELAKWCEV